MKKYEELINKLKDILSEELGNKKIFDKDIAYALDINYDNFRKQKARGSIPYPEIISFLAIRNISINWFFFNQLPESLIEPTSNYIILKYQKSVNASAGGGAINYEVNPETLIIDRQLLDHINTNYKYTEVLQALGESLEPDIKDNSLIFVDKSDTIIKSNNIYLINVDDSLYIKRIRQFNDKYYMSSINELYEDIELNEFHILGKVNGVLNKF